MECSQLSCGFIEVPHEKKMRFANDETVSRSAGGDGGRVSTRVGGLLAQWHAMAEARADLRILDESAREMVWILEGWDHTEEAASLAYRRATEYDRQLLLPFEDLSRLVRSSPRSAPAR